MTPQDVRKKKVARDLKITEEKWTPPSNIIKILVLGEGGVGGLTLILRYVTGVFRADTWMTIGAEVYFKNIELDGTPCTIQLWRLAGQDRFRFIIPSFTAGAKGAILLFDTTRMDTLDKLEEWTAIARTFDKALPVLLCGTKIDYVNDRSVKRDYAMSYLEPLGLFDYIEVSSKTGENVEEVMEKLVRKILETPPQETKGLQQYIQKRMEEESAAAKIQAENEQKWTSREETFLPEIFKGLWQEWARSGRKSREWCDICLNKSVALPPADEIGRVFCVKHDKFVPKNWWCTSYPKPDEYRRQAEENSRIVKNLQKQGICYKCGKRCKDATGLQAHMEIAHEPR